VVCEAALAYNLNLYRSHKGNVNGDLAMRFRPVTLCVLLFVFVFVSSVSFPVKCASWQQVTQFTGTGTQNFDTVEFRINGSEWRLVWSYTPNSVEPSLTVFSFFIFRHGELVPMADNVYESGSGNTSGVLNIHEGPSPYYLRILTANTEGYAITVECDKDSEVGTGLLMAIIALVIAIPVVIIVVMVVALRKRGKKAKPPLAVEQPLPPLPPPPPA
jgi:hypothetical protein